MNEDKKDLDFMILMTPKISRKECKKVINYVLIEYTKNNIKSSDVDNYFSMISRFGYRLQKQRDTYYNMHQENKDHGLLLKDILNNLNIKSSYN